MKDTKVFIGCLILNKIRCKTDEKNNSWLYFLYLPLDVKLNNPKYPPWKKRFRSWQVMNLKGRETGTEEELKAAEYIRGLMAGHGARAQGQCRNLLPDFYL